jgi:hypothetical protein
MRTCRLATSSAKRSMTFWGRCTGLAAAVVATACLNDPAAPAAYRLEVRPDTIRFVALRDTLRPLVLEHRGSTGPSPLFIGSYHILDSTIATVSSTGLITSRAAGSTRLLVRSPYGASDTAVVLVSQAIAGLHVLRDTVTLGALEALQPLEVVATDPLGSEIEDVSLQYDVQDTAIAIVTDSGAVRARANGITTVTVTGNDQSAAIVVRVAQRVMRIATAGDTMRFSALEQVIPVAAQPVDSLGFPVAGLGGLISVADTSIAVAEGAAIRSKRNGTTQLLVQAGGVESSQVIVVEQIPARITAAFNDTVAIRSVFQDSLIPVSCRIVDANGYDVPGTPVVLPSSAGRWSGSTCGDLRAQSSGADTLRLAFDSLSASLPLVLAVRPILGPVAPLDVDQLPPNTSAWAPSARRNSRGQIEVYFAGYSTLVDSTGHQAADLYRLVSDDGQHFSYDGVVLTHDPSYCDPIGSGIENIDIVPRADGPGWRMFFAGGSFDCYGWQVFSAISTDERTWTRESGVRLSNGGSVPPDAPVSAPWPAGEGMTTDQLPDGTWRMIVGTYEPVTPREDKFQVTEWRSPDQLQWTYLRSLVTTRQLPSTGQRSVYSPTIAEIAPGLWRMVFTADDLDQPGGRSRLWSAVSSDRVNWQLEGEILGDAGAQYFYSVLVGNRLFTLREPVGTAVTTLVGLTLDQP